MGINVLSLFDGMSCGMISFKESEIDVDRYVAYEIDEYAIQTSKHNFPEIEQCGDVFKADFKQYEGFDFVIGGSPCTYRSIARTSGRETTASGMGWDLFSQYVRAIEEVKPKYFIYENNYSMSNEIRAMIDKSFGFGAVMINSALVSAQNRERLYWVGVRQPNGTYKRVYIPQPHDRGIYMNDILDTEDSYCMRYERSEDAKRVRKDYEAGIVHHGFRELHELHPRPDGKSNTLSTVLKDNPILTPINLADNNRARTMVASYYKRGTYNFVSNSNFDATGVAELIPHDYIRLGNLPKLNGDAGTNQQSRIYDSKGKVCTITTSQGPFYSIEINDDLLGKLKCPIYEVKDGLITVNKRTYPIRLKDGFYIIRKLSVNECRKLQTIPNWYQFPVSDSQTYKMIGNGWTIEVIKYLINCALNNPIDIDQGNTYVGATKKLF